MVRCFSLSPFDLKGTAQMLQNIGVGVGVGSSNSSSSNTSVTSSPRHNICGHCYFGAPAPPVLIGNLLRYSSSTPTPPSATISAPAAAAGADCSPAAQLARLLYFQPHRYVPPALTRTKSMAAAHLTPRRMGALLGLALSNTERMTTTTATAISDEEGLAHIGIRSNFVDDERTGMSLQRWKDLLHLLRNPHHKDAVLVQALWMQALWSVSHTKNDLLHYILAVEEYGKIQILRDDELRRNPAVQDAWVRDTFTEDDLGTFDSAMEELLVAKSSAPALERVYAHLGLRRNYSQKPPVEPGRYSYDNGPIVADCVEMTVREILDFVLWNGSEFDLSRLPPTARDDVRALYRNRSGGDGQAWFTILSNLADSHYISRSPSGLPYELTPTLSNVAVTLHQLLFPQHTTTERWTRLEDLRAAFPHVAVDTARQSFRAALSDEFVHHETALVRTDENSGGGHRRAIEIRQDRNHAISTVTHLRQPPQRSSSSAESTTTSPESSDAFLTLLEHCLSSTDPVFQSLAVVLLNELNDEHLVSSSAAQIPDEPLQRFLFLALPYGPDRHLLPSSRTHSRDPPWLLSSPALARHAGAGRRQHRDATRRLVLSLPYGVDRRCATPVTTDLDRQAQAERQAYHASALVQLAALKLLATAATDDNDGNCELFDWLCRECPAVADHDALSFSKVTQSFQDELRALQEERKN